MYRFGLLAATLVAVAVALIAPLAAQAYVGTNPYTVTLATDPSGVVRCDTTVSITATVRSSQTGDLVAGQSVFWDMQSSPTTDTVSPTMSVTNGKGKASTALTFGPAEGK